MSTQQISLRSHQTERGSQVEGAGEVKELISQGFLSPYRYFVSEDTLTVKGVRSVGGDYSLSQLAEANPAEGVAGSLLQTYQQRAAGKRCVVFAINIEHSQQDI